MLTTLKTDCQSMLLFRVENIVGPYAFNKLCLKAECCCPWDADSTCPHMPAQVDNLDAAHACTGGQFRCPHMPAQVDNLDAHQGKTDLVRLKYSNCSGPDLVNDALKCMQIAHRCRHLQATYPVRLPAFLKTDCQSMSFMNKRMKCNRPLT